MDEKPAKPHASLPEEDAQAEDPGGRRFQDDPQPAPTELPRLPGADFHPHTHLPGHPCPADPSVAQVSVSIPHFHHTAQVCPFYRKKLNLNFFPPLAFLNFLWDLAHPNPLG